MMKYTPMYKLGIVLTVIMVLAISSSLTYGEPKTQIAIEVFVLRYPDEIPVANVKVIFYDWQNPGREVIIGLTDNNGYIKERLESGRYFVYVLEEREGILKSLPVKIDLTEITAGNVSIKVYLYKAATIPVEGTITVPGWTGVYWIQVYGVDGRRIGEKLIGGICSNIKCKVEVIDTFGKTEDSFRIGTSLGYNVLEKKIIVPENVPVYLVLSYTVHRIRERRLYTYTSSIGSPKEPLLITAGREGIRINLVEASIGGALNRVKEEVSAAISKLSLYESLGFYLPKERGLIEKAENLIQQASEAIEEKRFDIAMDYLDRAYTISHDVIEKQLIIISMVASEGAIIMPFFLALFSAIIVFYIFDDNRRKMIFFPLVYLLFQLTFTYLYPGFQLLWRTNKQFFIYSSSFSLFIFFTILFLIPRYVKEPELPGKISIPGFISSAFSIAKRYSKRKRIRTLITIASIAILIWAITVLSSFSTVYSKTIREFQGGEINALYVRRVVEGKAATLIYPLDIEILKEMGAKDISPRFYNLPKSKFEAVILAEEKKYVFHNIGGFVPTEAIYTPEMKDLFSKLDKKCILLPLTRKLFDIGSEVSLFIKVGSRRPMMINAEICGYFDEEFLKGKFDVPGYPMVPGHILLNDTILVNIEYISEKIPYDYFYSVFGLYSIASTPPIGEGLRIANNYLDRRGGGYLLITCSERKCLELKFDVKVETIFESNIAFLVPLAIVALNVMITMYGIVEERKKEIFIFNSIGFNPTHIATIFMAEAIVYGLLSGVLGYTTGLATFQVLNRIALEQKILLVQKLEWYWSFIAIIIAIIVAAIGSFKPAIEAAFKYAPTKVRKYKLEKVERERREEKYLVATAKKTIFIRAELRRGEEEMFRAFIITRLREIKGTLERVENVEDLGEEERADGTRMFTIKFDYIGLAGNIKGTVRCHIKGILKPEEKRYRIELDAEPVGKTPMKYVDYVADLVKNLTRDWEVERKYLF